MPGVTKSGREGSTLGIGHLAWRIGVGKEDAVDALRELEPALWVGRIGPVAVELGAHAPGVRAQEQNAVPQLDCLGDGMGDEEDREARALPELQQLLLHSLARERVEC